MTIDITKTKLFYVVALGDFDSRIMIFVLRLLRFKIM